ncbi:MAG: hypothetical protein LBJ70_03345 [Holosporales bacterium]|jgi:hypothetical protein|nr:hypothetical protein [Holosporales bacterium]
MPLYTKKALLIAVVLFSFLPKGEGMNPTKVITTGEERLLCAMTSDPARLQHILLHFVSNKADIQGIISLIDIREKLLHGILCLEGEDPTGFVQNMVKYFLAEAKRKRSSCFFGRGTVLMPDASNPDIRILTTGLELRGALVGVNERYRFYMFSHNRKIAKVKGGKLYKFNPAGRARLVEGFSGGRDMELRIHLRHYTDSHGALVRTEGTLFSALSEELLGEVLHYEKEVTPFSHLVNFLETTYTGDAYRWVQDRQENLYDLVCKFRAELPQGADLQQALFCVTGKALGGTIGREEQQELCGHLFSLLH